MTDDQNPTEDRPPRQEDFTINSPYSGTSSAPDLTPEKLAFAKILKGWANIFDACGDWINARSKDAPDPPKGY